MCQAGPASTGLQPRHLHGEGLVLRKACASGLMFSCYHLEILNFIFEHELCTRSPVGHQSRRMSRGDKHNVRPKVSFPHSLVWEARVLCLLTNIIFCFVRNLDFKSMQGSNATQLFPTSLFPISIHLATSHICYLSVFSPWIHSLVPSTSRAES